VLLTQQLGTLLRAGIALDRALQIAETLVETKTERAHLAAVLEDVRSGSSLADAMAARNGAFPPFYVGIVRAGEAGGTLDTTLDQLAEFLERSESVREQVKSALIYPVIVLVTGSLSVAALFGFVIPRLRPLFDQAGASLPLTTEIVLAVSDAFRDYWWAIAAVIALLAVVAHEERRRPEARRRWDRRLLQLPIIGQLIVKIDMGRFGRTLGTLLHNGIPPLAALAITQEALGNTALRGALAVVAQSVKEGKGLTDPLAESEFVPPLVVHLTRVGEETGRLDEMLLKLADIYDRETRRAIDRLLALLVPALTIGLGALVAVVIGSILTAILGVYDLAL
jgi:general secretion pathway protein F